MKDSFWDRDFKPCFVCKEEAIFFNRFYFDSDFFEKHFEKLYRMKNEVGE